MLERLAAQLFLASGAHGVERAVAQGLAGLVLAGSDEGLDPSLRQQLRVAARREAADHAHASREIDALLDTLAHFRPAILKGPTLAELWPAPHLRPPGDLDLLLDQEALDGAVGLLQTVGFRRAPAEPPSLVRRPDTGVSLLPPRDRSVVADLHVRLFRSVGHRLSGAALLARAHPDGRLRRLDDADRLLFTCVHAAKHGVRSAKWLFDVIALLHATGPEVLAEAQRRAREARVERPLDAALAIAERALGMHRPLLPFFSVEAALAARPLSRVGGYALELLLEPGLLARARMAAGLAERVLLARSGR